MFIYQEAKNSPKGAVLNLQGCKLQIQNLQLHLTTHLTISFYINFIILSMVYYP